MPEIRIKASPVTEVPAADPNEALSHFRRLLALETDCWDVHASMTDGNSATDAIGGAAGFVLLDVRSPELFAAGHLPGAINLPYRRIHEQNLLSYPADTLFVVYCSGPHCNGADRGAVKLAALGRKVKKMIGGVTGWMDEGFPLVVN